MEANIWVIAATAASIGFLHTITGPDHYLPFVMIGRARHWSYYKLALITILCGIGHVLSSIVIGFIGVAAGWAVSSLEGIESTRGDWAAYLLMGFGIAYFIWGLRKAKLGHKHSHLHIHADGTVHEHKHNHTDAEHKHMHEETEGQNITIWVLFIIFVLGPCEPLIPLVMVPAAEHSWLGVAFVSGIFGAITVITMTTIALLLYAGVKLISIPWLERYMHATAGFVIALSGAAIVFLGL